MKLKLSVFSILCALGVAAQAASITVTNFQGGNSNLLIDASGTLIPNGSGFVAIGTFGSTDGLNSIDAISAGFTQFSNSLTVGFNNFGGLYSGSINGAIDAASPFAGKDVYTVVGNASTLASSTQALVFKNDGVVFKADPDATDNVILNSTKGSLIVGGVGANQTLGPIVNQPSYQLANFGGDPVVPEPSSALLGLLGLSFVAFRRRR